MRKRALLLIVPLVALGVATPVLAHGVQDERPQPTITLPPCKTEDSDNCYWTGGRNGLGRSFVAIDGRYYYEEAGE